MAFKKGESGNLLGRPKGIQDKRTKLRLLLEPHVEPIVNKLIELALNGDTTALKLCMDRIIPVLKPVSQPINIDIPLPENLTDMAKIFLKSTASGDLSPDVAIQLISAIASISKIEEIETVKYRLEALERVIKA